MMKFLNRSKKRSLKTIFREQDSIKKQQRTIHNALDSDNGSVEQTMALLQQTNADWSKIVEQSEKCISEELLKSRKAVDLYFQKGKYQVMVGVPQIASDDKNLEQKQMFVSEYGHNLRLNLVASNSLKYELALRIMKKTKDGTKTQKYMAEVCGEELDGEMAYIVFTCQKILEADGLEIKHPIEKEDNNVHIYDNWAKTSSDEISFPMRRLFGDEETEQ